MANQKDFLEFGKTKLNQWKAMIEELEVQLALGKAEAKDMIKEEQKNVTKFFNEQKAQIQQAETRMAEHRMALANKLRDLEIAIKAKATPSKEEYADYRKTIMQLVHEVEYLTRVVYTEIGQKVRIKLDELKEALDNYRIQLALCAYDTREEIMPSQEALLDCIATTGELLDRENVKGNKKIEHFMDEISESFDHLKQAFSELLK